MATELNSEDSVFSDDQIHLMHERLDKRQCEILLRRVGHGYRNNQSLAYIAKDFKLSRERVRQIQNEALVKLNIPEVTHLVLLAETKATFKRNENRRNKLARTLLWRAKRDGGSQVIEQKVGEDSAYNPWSKEEDKRLWDAYKHGKSTQDLAQIHARSTGAIRSRIKKIKEGKVVVN